MKISDKTMKYIVGGAVASLIVFIIYKLRNKSKNSMIVVKDSYTVPPGTPSPGDAFHSFERRKSDGFGGRMSTKINEKLREMYKNGINPDISEIKINMDSKKMKVDWEATLVPSKDGKAYVGMSTVGSAGSGADSRAKSQIETMKTWNKGAQDYTQVLDFVNPTGIYVRQYFYKYTKPTEYPAH